jgi:hypothetical protein
MQKNNNNIENAFNQEKAFVYGRQGALFICAITTVLVVYEIGIHIAVMLGITSGLVQVLFASMLVFISYLSIDWTLLNSLSSFSNLQQGGKKGNMTAIIVLAVFSFVTSTGLSLVSNSILSSDMVGETKLLEYNDKLDEKNTQDSQNKQIAYAALGAAQAEEKENIKNAKKEASALLDDAINSRGSQMAALYKEGNGWAKAQLTPSINKAKKEGQRLIDEASNTAEKVEATYSSVLSYDVAKDTTMSAYMSVLQVAESERLQRKAGINLVLALLSILCGVIGVIISFALKSHREAFGQQIVEDHVTPIAKVFSLFSNAINLTLDAVHDIAFGLPTLLRKKEWLKGDRTINMNLATAVAAPSIMENKLFTSNMS